MNSTTENPSRDRRPLSLALAGSPGDLAELRESEDALEGGLVALRESIERQSLPSREGRPPTVQELLSADEHESIRDEVTECIWSTLSEWARVRAAADGGLPADEVGHWKLSETERVWVDGGLVSPLLCQDEMPEDELTVRVRQALEGRGAADRVVIAATDYLLERYRHHLGLDCKVGFEAEWETHQARVHHVAERLDERLRARREFLPRTPAWREEQDVQRRLLELLPHVARIKRVVRRGGLDRKNHRAQMKVFEVTRQLRQRILDRIDSFDQRKQYESIESSLLDVMVELQEAEEDWGRLLSDQRMNEGTRGRLSTPQECQTAVSAGVSDLKRRMAVVSATPATDEPPYLLEHLPRLSFSYVNERWEDLLRTCPRFQQIEAPRVLLLPGVGNFTFDVATGDVSGSLFPQEVHLGSVIAALGLAYLHRDPKLEESYARMKRIPPRSTAVIRKAFGKELIQWVEKDSAGRTQLEGDAQRWFYQQLMVRRGE